MNNFSGSTLWYMQCIVFRNSHYSLQYSRVETISTSLLTLHQRSNNFYKLEILTSLISSADKAPGRSCLLANTNNVAPASLWVNTKKLFVGDIFWLKKVYKYDKHIWLSILDSDLGEPYVSPMIKLRVR